MSEHAKVEERLREIAEKIARDLFGNDAEDNIPLILGDLLESPVHAAVVACDSIAKHIRKEGIDYALLPSEVYEFEAAVSAGVRAKATPPETGTGTVAGFALSIIPIIDKYAQVCQLCELEDLAAAKQFAMALAAQPVDARAALAPSGQPAEKS